MDAPTSNFRTPDVHDRIARLTRRIEKYDREIALAEDTVRRLRRARRISVPRAVAVLAVGVIAGFVLVLGCALLAMIIVK